MLFLNISADKIHAIVEGKETFIEHGELEKTISHFLQSKIKDKKSKINKVFIINGPGSFTNLRIATLSLNMYNFLNDNALDFYSIDKLTLYKKLYQKKLIPAIGYIYIGQKKNRRYIDLETMQYSQVIGHNSELITNPKEYFIDQTFGEGLITHDEGLMITLSWEADQLVVFYKGKESRIPFAEMDLAAVKMLEANYMMQPNVTMKEFK